MKRRRPTLHNLSDRLAAFIIAVLRELLGVSSNAR